MPHFFTVFSIFYGFSHGFLTTFPPFGHHISIDKTTMPLYNIYYTLTNTLGYTLCLD
jgi:hypothetical protein